MVRKIFDCVDFLRWTLGARYDFGEYEAPQGCVYCPDLDDVVKAHETQNSNQF